MSEPNQKITRQQLIDLLNEDLSREYQAIIAYVNYSQVIKGAAYMTIAKELEVHAGEELQHAITIANQIDYLGGMPTVIPQPVKTSEKAEDMLRFDLENENETIANYRVRVRQCEDMGEYAVAENIRKILVQEQEHQSDLATALGVDVPDVSRPDQQADPASGSLGQPAALAFPQVIPRPAQFRAGLRPVWSVATPSPVPLSALHSLRYAEPDSERTAGAAVLCLCFEQNGDTRVVLTRRSARLRSHAGEVCFPGGRLEPGESAEQAALREAWEEIGVPPESVRIRGRLAGVGTRTRSVWIVPVLGSLDAPPTLRPNPDEVDRAFTVSLRELLSATTHHQELWTFPDGRERAIQFFALEGDLVWGATARILCELFDLLAPQLGGS